MNRQTYPILCSWCGLKLDHTSSVPNSSGICPACLGDLREEARRQFTPTLHDPTGPIKGTMDNNPPWDDDSGDERRKIIDEAWHQPSSFIDGFLIGGAVATLLGILAHWAIHYFR